MKFSIVVGVPMNVFDSCINDRIPTRIFSFPLEFSATFIPDRREGGSVLEIRFAI